jgi:hypothetical protein
MFLALRTSPGAKVVLRGLEYSNFEESIGLSPMAEDLTLAKLNFVTDFPKLAALFAEQSDVSTAELREVAGGGVGIGD